LIYFLQTIGRWLRGRNPYCRVLVYSFIGKYRTVKENGKKNNEIRGKVQDKYEYQVKLMVVDE
jgi:superfamily II DNA or RNA helicase